MLLVRVWTGNSLLLFAEKSYAKPLVFSRESSSSGSSGSDMGGRTNLARLGAQTVRASSTIDLVESRVPDSTDFHTVDKTLSHVFVGHPGYRNPGNPAMQL